MALREKARKKLWLHYLKNGIPTDDDLHFLFSEFLNIDVPRTVHPDNPDHTAPFKFISDLFFERVDYSLLFANRGGGKTRGTSLLNFADMVGKPGIDATVAAATLYQSTRNYDYLTEYFAYPHIRPLVTSSIKSYSELENGSKVEIVSGTLNGVNGPHSVLLRIDEVELIDPAVLEDAMSIPISKHGYTSSVLLVSTRRWSTGLVQKLINEADETGLKIYKYNIFDVLQRCTRECKKDPKYGNCPAFNRCKGKAHKCSKEGWYLIADFVKKARSLTDAVWKAQWLCDLPHEGETYYGEYYNSKVHKVSWDFFYKMTGYKRPPPDWPRVGGCDPSQNFYCGIAAIDPRTNTWWWYFEYFYSGDRLLKDHAGWIAPGIQGCSNVIIFSDPARKQDALELKAQGIPMEKGVNAFLAGIDSVRTKLQVDPVTGPQIFFIEEETPYLTTTLPQYSMELDLISQAGILDKPIKVDDHGCDSLRYAILSYLVAQRAKTGTATYVEPGIVEDVMDEHDKNVREWLLGRRKTITGKD